MGSNATIAGSGSAGKPRGWARRAWILLVLWAVTLILGCASGEGRISSREGTGTHNRSGRDEYITATGCVPITEDPAADRAAADRAARAEVAKQIEVKVVQLVEDIQAEEQTREERIDKHIVSIRTREFVARTLKGVRINERRRDEAGGEQCSVAVLDRRAAAAQIRGEIDQALGEIRTALSGARAALDGGRFTEALREYTIALVSLDRVYVDAGLLRDLGEQPPPIPSLVEVRREWKALVEGIHLEPAGGDGQRVKPQSPFPEPLRVKARDGFGRPVPDLPLKVLLKPKDCAMQAGARTDEAGEAVFQVYGVPARGRAIEEIGIGIDWRTLLGPAVGSSEEDFLGSSWDAREVVFTCILPVPADFRVGVAIFESGTGRPLRDSPVQTLVLEGLQEAGFKTRDLLAASLLSARPSTEEARRVLADRIDILVTGEVSLRYSSEVAGLVFYRAKGVLEAISLSTSTGRTLVTLEREAKGGGLDETRAVRKAVANLAYKLKEGIVPALEKTLE